MTALTQTLGTAGTPGRAALHHVDPHAKLGVFCIAPKDAPDWVNVVPVTEDGRVVFVRQFRHGAGKVTLDGRYTFGLTDVFDEDSLGLAEAPDAKSGVFQVTLGVGL